MAEDYLSIVGVHRQAQMPFLIFASTILLVVGGTVYPTLLSVCLQMIPLRLLSVSLVRQPPHNSVIQCPIRLVLEEKLTSVGGNATE